MVASREDAAMSQPYVRILGFGSALRVVKGVPEQLNSLFVERVSRADPSSSSYWAVLWCVRVVEVALLTCDYRHQSVMFHLVEAGILDHGCEPRMGFRISSETPASKMQPQPCSAAADENHRDQCMRKSRQCWSESARNRLQKACVKGHLLTCISWT